MSAWRIEKGRRHWGWVIPDKPWVLSRWDAESNCRGNVGDFATWQEAVDWLIAAWPIWEGQPCPPRP